MSIASEIIRIQAAKAALKAAINAKGGNLSAELLDDYAVAVENISTGADLSPVTVTSGDMLKGKTAIASDGTLITGTIETVVPENDGVTVTVPAGFLAESYSFPLDTGGTDTSDATVTAEKLLAGVTAYGASGKITGSIATVTATVTDNVVNIPRGFIAESETVTIPSAPEAAVSGNVVTLFKGYQATEKSIEVGFARGGGEVIPGASDQVIAAGTYLTSDLIVRGDADLVPGNIRNGVTLFGVSGSCSSSVVVSDMELYKCAAVHGPYEVTRIKVSGAGTTAVNGDYEKTTLTTSGGYEVWKHMTTDYYLYRMYSYQWAIHSDYTTDAYNALYYCESEDPFNGTWYTGYDYSNDTATGVAPVPTLSKFQVTMDEDVPKTWDGYKAVLTDGVYVFEENLTAGLTYGEAFTPKVGGIYNREVNVKVASLLLPIPQDGLVFYAPLSAAADTAETGQALAVNGNVTYSTVDGIPCASFSGSYLSGNGGGSLPQTDSDRTFSCWAKASSNDTAPYGLFAYGNAAENQCIQWLISGKKIQASGGYNSSNEGYSNEIADISKWHHYTVKHSNGVSYFYVDGVASGSFAYTRNTSSDSFSIGIALDHSTGSASKNIAAVRLYDRALTDKEISDLANEFNPTA